MIFIAEGFQVICHLSTSDMSPIRKGSLHGRINHGFVEGRGKLADCCYQAHAKGTNAPICASVIQGVHPIVGEWGMNKGACRQIKGTIIARPSGQVSVSTYTPDVIGIALISCHHLFGLRVGRLTMKGGSFYRLC
ncbi:hypothetical protein CEXT_438221 [Caerostris extrusa]|uniref:Uncharacterized protein n=1 Tax=Caerostris extrusa TaxID=172846 RepID=A0AAV4Y910_CAEEX|nr:hypothetical protein CEXT_438221 [Caerostris extrusa]